jgi:PA14 domain
MIFDSFLHKVLRWLVSSAGRTLRRPQLALDKLEGREIPSVGGGFTAGGIQGDYFADGNLSGTPAFTRRDVRIDFDWQSKSPGGSNSPSFRAVGADNYSVRWTGALVPRFSEAYSFKTTTDDGVRLWIRPTGSANWTPLIDHWAAHGAAVDTGTYTMTAGQSYDLRMEYYELSGAATAKLRWSSNSTPEETIEPAVSIGVNAVTYDYNLYADATKSGRAEWGDVVDYFNRPNVATDSAGWPLGDAGHIFWEGQDPAKTAGTYLFKFTGRAEVASWMGRGQFVVNGTNYGATLPAGVGYDVSSNTTTAQMVIAGTDLLALNFRHTQRTSSSPENSGITNVQMLRPLAPGSTATFTPGELFDTNVKTAFARFTTLRYLTANFNAEREWSERMLPGNLKAAFGDRRAVWENEVLLANETGKDLYITLPVNASPDYVRKLANLIRYGSDGVNPYSGPVDNPAYPGLNPNLRIYVEFGNEVWNWAFTQAQMGSDAARDAVANRTPDGQVINFDGQRPRGDFRRWAALKTVQASNTFRSVFGDAEMGERVRVVLEYQYDNEQDTAVEALKFIDNFFNNADGSAHVPNPHPVNYFIWGAGGASYFGASNPRGLVDDIFVPDGSFEGMPINAGQAQVAPAGSPWVFSGDAGIYRNPPGFEGNARIAVNGVGAVPTTPAGSQALYISGAASVAVNIDFPRAGVYALDFRAAAELDPNMGNPLDFYFDDQRVTPNAQDLNPKAGPWTPGTGFGRDASAFTTYGTVPVYVPAPGRHTFRIVGRGSARQTTLIDDMRVASTDAIFASRIPGGGQAAGQVSRFDYETQLATQARYAKAYGLKVVAYEGGWSLGGDVDSVPIESYAKYRDSRAADVMAVAIDAFFRAGGELDVLGTYDQWHLDDAANADSYPLIRGIDARIGGVPAVATLATASVPTPPTPTMAPMASPAAGLPNGWTADSIGSPDIAGSVDFDGVGWSIHGAGENIWGSADQFEFAHTTINGDMAIVAHVDSLERTHGWAKAGLMVRAGVGASDQFAGIFLTPDNGVQFETRSGYRSAPVSIGAAANGPLWLKLVRNGNSFAAYYSADGQRWTRIGDTISVAMPASAQVGLIVTSHDTAKLATATFSNVSVVN